MEKQDKHNKLVLATARPRRPAPQDALAGLAGVVTYRQGNRDYFRLVKRRHTP